MTFGTSDGGSRVVSFVTDGDSFGVNCDELGSGPWTSVKAVVPVVLGCKHLLDPFRIDRVANVASR